MDKITFVARPDPGPAIASLIASSFVLDSRSVLADPSINPTVKTNFSAVYNAHINAVPYLCRTQNPNVYILFPRPIWRLP